MPPKKAPQQPSKKADAKKKDKIIEDKTFGLKNKKGAKQQRFIQQVEKQVKFGNNPKKAAEAGAKKEDKKKELADLLIFRPVASQKIEKGVDPKSVLCAFFKQGQCTKGDKCKFSHDLNIERKAEKKSLYFDAREGEGNPEDNMENWDEEKLKEVVAKKHGAKKKLPPTDIICKHFLAAIELNKYGWFWECPAGGDKCHYRHALPPGFVLKRDKKKDKKDEDITIEELVEIERSKLGYNLTKITLETFIAWKKKKVAEKQATAKKESDRKKAEFKAGKNLGLSGREMFTFNPEMAKDGDMEEGEAAMDIVREDQDEDGAAVKEIDLEAIACEAIDTDGTGTQAEATPRNFSTTKRPTEGGEENSTTSAAASETKAAENGDEGGGDEDIINEPIDESLFAEDDLDDLEDDLAGVSLKG